MNKYDVIIIGSGFSGSVLAREFAEINKKVLVVEKRNHIGGNSYEEIDENGIRVHKYGPHIFHTNSEKAFLYLRKFGEWFFYEHRVLGLIDGTFVPIPFNFKSIELLFDGEKSSKIKKMLTEKFSELKKISIIELINNDDPEINEFGKYVYNKVFVNYTAKQWGVSVDQVDSSVINRVPVILGYDDRYFQDKFQYMPLNGYSEIINSMLNHENIDVEINKNIKDYIDINTEEGNIKFNNKIFKGIVIYTGALDELFDYKYGALEYRSLNLVFENYKMNYYQPKAVVNYPNDEEYTRITEFKYLSNQISTVTTILKEYPLAYNYNNPQTIPFYPILNDLNKERYNQYHSDVCKLNNFYICGRLAEYKYYDMDAVILNSLDLFEKINKGGKNEKN